MTFLTRRRTARASLLNLRDFDDVRPSGGLSSAVLNRAAHDLVAEPIIEAVRVVQARKARDEGHRAAVTMTAVALTAAVVTASYLWWRRREQPQRHRVGIRVEHGVATLLPATRSLELPQSVQASVHAVAAEPPPPVVEATEVGTSEAEDVTEVRTPLAELEPTTELEVIAGLEPLTEAEPAADLGPTADLETDLEQMVEAEPVPALAPGDLEPEAVADPEPEFAVAREEEAGPTAAAPIDGAVGSDIEVGADDEATVVQATMFEPAPAPSSEAPVRAVAPDAPRAEPVPPALAPPAEDERPHSPSQADRPAARLAPKPSFQPLTTKPFTVPSPRPKLPGSWRNPLP